MSRLRRISFAVILAIPAAYAGGCNTDDDSPAKSRTPSPKNATSTSASQPTPPPRNPIVEESLEWSRDEALANLEDDELGLSAAVRLVRLAEVDAPAVPDPLPVETAVRLKLLPLSDTTYALGFDDAENPRLLRSAVIIDTAGDVSVPGGQEGGMDLHVSRDGDVFPHLFLAGDRVILAETPEQAALVLSQPNTLRFELRDNDGYPYLVLAAPGGVKNGAAAQSADAEANGSAEAAVDGGKRIEVARYNWDPYELLFMGPASDAMPDPPGGRFELDMAESLALIPVGGEIGDPDPIEPMKDAAVDDDF